MWPFTKNTKVTILRSTITLDKEEELFIKKTFESINAFQNHINLLETEYGELEEQYQPYMNVGSAKKRNTIPITQIVQKTNDLEQEYTRVSNAIIEMGKQFPKSKVVESMKGLLFVVNAKLTDAKKTIASHT